ncbi:MAG: lipoyl(octanoyl) transferase LipB [Pseudomonadota bacterium]
MTAGTDATAGVSGNLTSLGDFLSGTSATVQDGSLLIRQFDLRPSQALDYVPVWDAMRQFTANRNADTPDQIWMLTHQPVFTQGQAGKPEHLLNTAAIPVVQIDRGGQVTYHGPGQLVAYVLIDVRRSGIGVRELVENIEQSVIDVLAQFGIVGESQRKAPGVYVNGAKIAALGLRIRQGCSYHGVSFNVDMDLAPFQRINPCGYEGMPVTQLRDLLPGTAVTSDLLEKTAQLLGNALLVRLGKAGLDLPRD